MRSMLYVIALVGIVAFIGIAPAHAGRHPIPVEAPVSNVVVSVHPTVKTVLVVSWSQDEAVVGGWLEFSINGGAWRASPERKLAQGPQKELVLGAPADVLVKVRIMNRFHSTPVSSAEDLDGHHRELAGRPRRAEIGDL